MFSLRFIFRLNSKSGGAFLQKTEDWNVAHNVLMITTVSSLISKASNQKQKHEKQAKDWAASVWLEILPSCLLRFRPIFEA